MKILIVSDTHGALQDSVIGPIKEEKNINLMIHCGDKYKDAEKLAQVLNIKDYYRVTGNCDFDIKKEYSTLILNIFNKKVLVTHGHLHHVKDGLDLLKNYAEDINADIVLFGHTHEAHDEIYNNILYFNPGSTVLPRTGPRSYGIINISEDKITSEIVYLK